MKFLAFWAVIIFAIYYFSKKKKNKPNSPQNTQSSFKANNSHHDSAIVMVECAHCKTHFPNNESIDYFGETFCSVEHKNLGRK